MEENEGAPGSVLLGTSDVGEVEAESEPPFKRFCYLASILNEKQKEQTLSCTTTPNLTIQQELDKYIRTLPCKLMSILIR